MIISAYQAKQLLDAYKKEKSVKVSLDLGLNESEVIIYDRFVFPGGQTLTVSDIKKVIKKDTMCFFIEDSTIAKIAIFSEETNNYYKLVPTGLASPPTIEISGIRMHVTKQFSPKEDTEKKISFVEPCTGKVLDTTTGLGYTAILAARTADEVWTYEIDMNVIELQKINPWSEELFTSQKIKRHHGDIFEEIKKLPAGYFDRIIHDPPRLALATLLYSQEFYNQFFRVLKKGVLFHYTGDPGSKKGLDIRAGVIKRLQKSGFKNVERVFNGVRAEK
jgi:uncharacterized protein